MNMLISPNSVARLRQYDWTLPLLVLGLASFGLVMVTSASMHFAAGVENYSDGWYFARRHALYLILALVGLLVAVGIPTRWWQLYAGLLLLVSLLLLVAVLLPGVGRSVNGSQRWINLGPFTVQVSEIAKFAIIVFFGDFLARRQTEVAAGWNTFAVMVAILGVTAVLLLMEPDFGSAVVIGFTAGAMMFVGGVRLFRFATLALMALAALAVVAVASPYRWERLVTFLDPWASQFSSGYQLVQSLIAFGRGEWFGVGLGNSIQKLFFLPEAHTDFIFAIIAEEFGLVGAVVLVGAFALLVYKIFAIAQRAYQKEKLFTSFVCFGAAVMLAGQAFINMGVASGLLPTKGLTLPLISYGGSSLIMTCALLGVVIRMDWELRRE